MFTDQDPEKEDPQLFWRRDAILTIDMEKKVFCLYVCRTLIWIIFILLALQSKLLQLIVSLC